MKTKAFLMMLMIMLGAVLYAAVETSPGWSYGYELGVARGDNAGKAENFAPMGSGHIQLKVFPALHMRMVLGFTPLHATKSSPEAYSTATLLGDYRLIFNPWYKEKLSPFIYSGVGASLDLSNSDADVIPHIPVGLGLQTQVKPGMNLEFTLGYNLANSDGMDGRIREDDDTNTFTGKKQDGFYSFGVGFTFYNPGIRKDKEVRPVQTVQRTPVPVVDLRTIDSDGDGLSDYDEINVYGTDPRNPDTDGDGLSDYAELLRHRTDPLNPDTDGDGLTDYAEIMQYGTDPLKVDTDGDGLSDYNEVITYNTNPLKVDTDDDGLSDYDEIVLHKTNPLEADTDRGSVNDGDEITAGTNPLDPRDDVLDLRVGAVFALDGIFFETAKSTIKPESIAVLQKAYTALAANPEVKILINGHTDSVGSDASNLILSRERASSVRNWLIEKGIAAERIRTSGRGEAQPRATNDTEEGRTLNRRIEFVVE
jgi:outer membrane protein OmpA-like peptidoglycan-associated protein